MFYHGRMGEFYSFCSYSRRVLSFSEPEAFRAQSPRYDFWGKLTRIHSNSLTSSLVSSSVECVLIECFHFSFPTIIQLRMSFWTPRQLAINGAYLYVKLYIIFFLTYSNLTNFLLFEFTSYCYKTANQRARSMNWCQRAPKENSK